MRNITKNTTIRKRKYKSILNLVVPFSVIKNRYRIKLHIHKQIYDNNMPISKTDKAVVTLFLFITGTSLTSGFIFFLYLIKSLLGFDFFVSHVL